MTEIHTEARRFYLEPIEYFWIKVRVSLSSIQLQPAMILAFQLALCGLCGLVQARFEACWLARPTRKGTLEEDLEEEEDPDYQGGASSDYMKRWEGVWEKQEPLHRLSHFVALAVRAARDPSSGKLIPTLLSHFWSWPSGDPKEALVATTLQWTPRNVKIPWPGRKLNISSHMTAVKTWLEKHVDDPAVNKIKEARAEAQAALQDIKDSQKISERALGIANYLLAATSLMVMWREEYNLLGTEEVRVNMEGAYKEITETLRDLQDAFWTYRFRLIKFIKKYFHPVLYWRDELWWVDCFIDVKRIYSIDRAYWPEFQDVVTDYLKREIFVLELAPMLTSFTRLHRLIPGREEEPPESEPFFREEIQLGPYSGFMMGTEAWGFGFRVSGFSSSDLEVSFQTILKTKPHPPIESPHIRKNTISLNNSVNSALNPRAPNNKAPKPWSHEFTFNNPPIIEAGP